MIVKQEAGIWESMMLLREGHEQRIIDDIKKEEKITKEIGLEIGAAWQPA